MTGDAAGREAGFADRHKVAVRFAVVLAAFFAGTGAALAAGYEEQAISSGLISLFVVGTALAIPGPVSYPAAVIIGAITTVGLFVAEVTTGNPVAAGVAMALVSLLMSVSKAGGKVAFAIGMVLGMGYFLPAVLGLVDGISDEDVVELGLAGILSGLLLVIAISAVRRLVGGKPGSTATHTDHSSRKPALALMWSEVRSLGPDARNGIRRGLLLGTIMGFYQVDGDVNLFWVLLTVNLVLQADASASWHRALARSSGAVVGALLVGILSQLLPASVMIGLGALAVVFGISWYRKDYAVYAACVTFLAVSIYGADTGSFWTWAGLRVLDTVIGATIAMLSLYLIFPAKRPEVTT